jgi:aminoglycoside 3-N-acetyltransferase
VKIKPLIKRVLKQIRTRYVSLFHSYDGEKLRAALTALPLSAGDRVLVHSSFDAFEGFTGKATDVIATLQSIVTPSGQIMMPTMPFTGTAAAYAQSAKVFDPARTPSRMGILTELFRRMPGVARSLHPTHSVAMWGAAVEELVAPHAAATTPCGRGSPYENLLKRQGKVLFLGTDLSSFTLYHTFEELLEDRWPQSPFTQESYRMQSRDAAGNSITTQTRLFEPAMSRRRNLFKLLPYLRRKQAIRETRVGQLSITLVDAQGAYDALQTMLNERVYCYD